MAMMIYLAMVNWYFQCGDESDHGGFIVGAYFSREEAEKRGQQYLLENYQYDKETNVFFAPGCNEATYYVVELELNKDVDIGL